VPATNEKTVLSAQLPDVTLPTPWRRKLGTTVPVPALEVEVGGRWKPVDVIAGAPAGKTKTILIDLAANCLPAAAGCG